MPLQPVLTASEEASLPVVKWFLDFPLENYATFGDLYFANSEGEIVCRLLTTGKVTKVDKRYSFWVSEPSGVDCASIDYDEPRDLPRDPNKVAVINASAYHDLLAWNQQCLHQDDKVDLSWMVLLSSPLRDNVGRPLRNLYRGVYLTPEVMSNRRLVSDELRQRLHPASKPSRSTML